MGENSDGIYKHLANENWASEVSRLEAWDRNRPHRACTYCTLSQKQFGKYFGAEIFPASMGIIPVLFKKISIQQHPRKKYL
jgi:hypothetical protein